MQAIKWLIQILVWHVELDFTNGFHYIYVFMAILQLNSPLIPKVIITQIMFMVLTLQQFKHGLFTLMLKECDQLLCLCLTLFFISE